MLDYINFDRKNTVFALFLTVICYLNLNSILAFSVEFFNRYSSYYETALNVNLATILNFVVVFVVFVFGEIFIKNKDDRYVSILRKLMFLNVLISFIATNVPMFGRFILLFGSLMILYLPLIVEGINSFNNRFLSKVLVVFGFLSYFYIILILKPEWNVIVPYKNIIIEMLF